MGDRSEREFCKVFEATDGWKADRAAASGGGTTAELPDVRFGQHGIAFAGEEKQTEARYIRPNEREVDELETYAEAFGMHAVIVGRFKHERAWYLWNPDDMERTDSGNYRGSRDDGRWFAKIAHPDGTADGVYPSDVPSWKLRLAWGGWIDPLRTPEDLEMGWGDAISLDPDADHSVCDPPATGDGSPGTEVTPDGVGSGGGSGTGGVGSGGGSHDG